ncbi:MAG TPA: GNAT family N-acetyltransferase [Dehalococcoidia bacterium]
MTSAATLRPATKDDADRVARLHAESWRTAYRGIYADAYLDGPVFDDRIRVWRERFATSRDGQHVLLAETEAGLEGFICVFGDDDDTWGSLIDNLHVAPGHKRRGIGARLMHAGALWLHEHYPKSGVYLWVLQDNAPARRFYERLGARDEGAVEHDMPGGGSAFGCRYVWQSPQSLETASAPYGTRSP